MTKDEGFALLADMRRKYLHAKAAEDGMRAGDWSKGEPITATILERWIPQVEAIVSALQAEPPARQCDCTVACHEHEYGGTYGGACRLAANRQAEPPADVLEFLRAYISGGVNQDFKLWARELYEKLYRADESLNCPRCHQSMPGGEALHTDHCPALNRQAEPPAPHTQPVFSAAVFGATVDWSKPHDSWQWNAGEQPPTALACGCKLRTETIGNLQHCAIELCPTHAERQHESRPAEPK